MGLLLGRGDPCDLVVIDLKIAMRYARQIEELDKALGWRCLLRRSRYRRFGAIG